MILLVNASLTIVINTCIKAVEAFIEFLIPSLCIRCGGEHAGSGGAHHRGGLQTTESEQPVMF